MDMKSMPGPINQTADRSDKIRPLENDFKTGMSALMETTDSCNKSLVILRAEDAAKVSIIKN